MNDRTVEFAKLRVLSSTLEDLIRVRIQIANRVGAASRDGVLVAETVEPSLSGLAQAEEAVAKAMRRQFRIAAPEIAKWAKGQVGIAASGNDRLIARLIGVTGHPVIATPYHWATDPLPAEGHPTSDTQIRSALGGKRVLVADPPFLRTHGQWLAYCGHGDPARKRRAGMTAAEAFALGNPRAKMLAHLLAEGCIKCVGTATVAAGPKADSLSHDPGEQPKPATDPIGTPAARSEFSDPPLVAAKTMRDAVGQSPEPNERAHPNEHPAPEDPDQPIAEANSTGYSAGRQGDGDGPTTQANPTQAPVRRRSPYRDVYDEARVRYQDRGWTPAHEHNAALRLVAKTLLLDLYDVAKGSL